MIEVTGTFNEKMDRLKELIQEKPCLILPMAIPGSGKSYISKKIVQVCGNDKVKIVSTDAIRKELFGSEESQEDNNLVFLIAHRQCRKWFYHGFSVIFDAVNIDQSSRNWSYKRAIPFAMQGEISKIVINIETELETALERNRTRKRFVPENVIYSFLKSKQLPKENECDYIITINN